MTLSARTADLFRMVAWPLPVIALLLLGACQRPSVRQVEPPAQEHPPAVDGTVYDAPTDIPEMPPLQEVRPVEHVAVALLLPLSGPDAAIGQAMLDAAQFAVFDIADDRFRLKPYDTAGTPDGAHAAAERAIADGAQLILGPLFSTSVAEVAPLARDRGINVIAFSNNRSVASNGAFLIGLLPRGQIERVVSYAARQGLRRFATLIPDTPFGIQVAEDLRETVERFGGEVTRVQTYPAGLRDLSQPVRLLGDYDARKRAHAARVAQLERSRNAGAQRELRELSTQETIGELDYDAILLPQTGTTLKSIAALLPFFDIDTGKIQLLGMASWHQPGLGSEPPLVGAWYPAPQIEARREFDRRFSETYGYGAPQIATLAYDATALASVLARRTDGPDFSVDALIAPNGFAGTAGIFRLLPNGESQRSLAIMEVRPSRVRVLDPAPTRFGDFVN